MLKMKSDQTGHPLHQALDKDSEQSSMRISTAVKSDDTLSAAKQTRKRGGQPGNTNAVGNRGGGAPLGNNNAVRHGGYSAIRHLTAEELEMMAMMPTDCKELLQDEIRLFSIRERRLMKMIAWAKSSADGLLKISANRAEDLREFADDEEQRLYEQRIAVQGSRLPGHPYSLTTTFESTDTVILRLEECLTRCQQQRQKAIEFLIRLNAETPPATSPEFVVAVLLGKK